MLWCELLLVLLKHPLEHDLLAAHGGEGANHDAIVARALAMGVHVLSADLLRALQAALQRLVGTDLVMEGEIARLERRGARRKGARHGADWAFGLVIRELFTCRWGGMLASRPQEGPLHVMCAKCV